MLQLPPCYCDLSTLSLENRYNLESNIKKFCGISPHPEPPSERAVGLKIDPRQVGINRVSLTMMGRDPSLPEVTLPELKEIISNAKQQ